MTTNRKTVHKSDIRLKPIDSLSEAVHRRARNKLVALDEKSTKQNQALARQLMVLRLEYRRNLSALMGTGSMRRYRELREKLAKAPRAQRIRESRALLEEIGFDRVRADRLRKNYLDNARKLLRLDDLRIAPHGGLLDVHHCSPWVTYTAPYGGYFWSFAWRRSDEASNPVLVRHLDNITGQIGSSIETRLSGADDDDFLEAEYYTALNTWHTALATGPIEGYLAFEFRNSRYSGRVSDEFGFSNATFSQLARARFRVLDTQAALDTQESRIFVFIDTDWGDGTSWSNFVSVPRDLHWYYFKTEASFAQGSALVLEAGIWNMTWFIADDESIRTANDLDLRLERMMVRSCPS